MLTGEVKQVLIKVLQDFVADFNEKRKRVTDEDVKKFMAVRKIDAMPTKFKEAAAADQKAQEDAKQEQK